MMIPLYSIFMHKNASLNEIKLSKLAEDWNSSQKNLLFLKKKFLSFIYTLPTLKRTYLTFKKRIASLNEIKLSNLAENRNSSNKNVFSFQKEMPSCPFIYEFV